jgi:RecJ-like exonuclease
MPEGISLTSLTMDLEDLILGSLDKGKIVRICNENKAKTKSVHYATQSIRQMAKEMYKIYQNPQATRDDFVAVLEKNTKIMHDNIGSFLDGLDVDDDMFVIEDKIEDSKGNITVKFTKISATQKNQLVKDIAKTLLNKMDKNQLLTLLQEGIKHNNDVINLKKIKKKLEVEKPTIEGKRGCYKLVVGGEDIFILR